MASGYSSRQNFRIRRSCLAVGIGVDESRLQPMDSTARGTSARRSVPLPRRMARQHLAAKIQALGYLLTMVQRHYPVRLYPEVRIAIAGGNALPGNFQDVSKPSGGDEPKRGEALLQQRVGRDGGAMIICPWIGLPAVRAALCRMPSE